MDHGWQPSYRTEGQIYGNYLRAEHPGAKLGMLYQNDDFGKDYLAGLRDVIGAAAPLQAVSYEITDATIGSQLVALQAAGVDVLISAASPKFAALAIRRLSELRWKPLHVIRTSPPRSRP